MKKQIFNPILPLDEYVPDGEPHVFDDRVYLFGSHDEEGGMSYCMLDYVCWSAPVDDLTDWSCSGSIYSARQDPLYGEWSKYLYAPDVVRGNDGRYYLYYCLAGWRGKGGYANPVSVAVCDTPDGKYEYLGVVQDKNGKPLTRYICFDPGVINDNGTIRLYYGTNYPRYDKIKVKSVKDKAIMEMSGRTKEELDAVPDGIMGAYHVTLMDDMLTISSDPVRIDNTIAGADYEDHSFFEASSIRRIDGTYYFIWSSINNHELCYATSKRPDGGFVYGGTIISTGDVGLNGRLPKDRLNHTGTTHGSIEKINGEWYVFYHRLTHNSDYSRQACAEKITIREDGKIEQVPVTSCGLNDGALIPEGIIPAPVACNITNGRMKHGGNSNKRTKEPCVTDKNDERFITGIREGNLIGYKYFDFNGPVNIRVRTRGSKGNFEVRTSPQSESYTIKLYEQEGWTVSDPVTLDYQGIHPLFFIFHGRGSIDFADFILEPHKA